VNSPFTLPACFFLGAVLAAFYFGGLWLTVKRLPQSRQPTLLSMSSFVARSLICLAGFYLVVGQGIEAVLICLSGFVLTKMALIHRISLGSRKGEGTRWYR
jgi:F1F0 ATPase subunit 2